MNPGERFTQFCAEKYEEVFCTLPHEIRLSITKVMNDILTCDVPVMSDYWFVMSVNLIRQIT